jgi:hypothetical protein
MAYPHYYNKWLHNWIFQVVRIFWLTGQGFKVSMLKNVITLIKPLIQEHTQLFIISKTKIFRKRCKTLCVNSQFCSTPFVFGNTSTIILMFILCKTSSHTQYQPKKYSVKISDWKEKKKHEIQTQNFDTDCIPHQEYLNKTKKNYNTIFEN